MELIDTVTLRVERFNDAMNKKEMSIDEAIKQLETYTIPCGKYKVAYDLAVETMRKYKQIEQIRHRVKHTDLEPAKAYELINEVLEDGKRG